MKVTALLCDHAQVVEGKLYVLGGGWTVNGPGPFTHTVGLLVHVPWNDANRRLSLVMELLTADGRSVTQPGPLGELPVRVDGEFEVGRPVGMPSGGTIDVPLVAPLPAMALPAGQQFVWKISVDGRARAELPFSTRPDVAFGPLGPTGLGPGGMPGPPVT